MSGETVIDLAAERGKREALSPSEAGERRRVAVRLAKQHDPFDVAYRDICAILSRHWDRLPLAMLPTLGRLAHMVKNRRPPSEHDRLFMLNLHRKLDSAS